MFESELPRFVDDLLAGQRGSCSSCVHELVAAGVDLRTIYEKLFRDALYEVGRRWENGQATVAAEHQATAIVEYLLAQLSASRPETARSGRSAVVSASLSEFHQVGARIVADTLELRGWRVHFVGAGTLEDELVKTVECLAPDLLALSVSLTSNLGRLWPLVDRIHALSPGPRVVVGGQAIAYAEPDALAAHACTALGSIDELDALVRAWPA